MLSYTGKRLLQTIFVLLGISLITFVLLQVVPGDPVALMLEKRADPETIAKVRKELGLDLPYYVQYLNFIKGASPSGFRYLLFHQGGCYRCAVPLL